LWIILIKITKFWLKNHASYKSDINKFSFPPLFNVIFLHLLFYYFRYLDKNCTYSLRALKRDRALKASQSDLLQEGNKSPKKSTRDLLKGFADDLRGSTRDLLKGNKGEHKSDQEGELKGSEADTKGKGSKDNLNGAPREGTEESQSKKEKMEEEKKEAEDKVRTGEGEKEKQRGGTKKEMEEKETEGKEDTNGETEDVNDLDVPLGYCEYKCTIL
jgi:hypothetical protein